MDDLTPTPAPTTTTTTTTKDHNEEAIPLLITGIVGSVLVIIVLFNTALKNGKLTCNRYLLNSFLYVLLAILLAFTTIKTYEFYNVKVESYIFWGSFVVSILSIIGVFFVKNLALQHVLWLMFVASMGTFLYPLYKSLQEQQDHTVGNVLLAMAGLLGVLLLVIVYRPNWVKLSWGPVLFMTLIGVVLLSLLNLIFGSKTGSLVISYVSVVLFSIYLLYDTKIILLHAEKCGPDNPPAYPQESMGVFTDILNIFVNIANIQNS